MLARACQLSLVMNPSPYLSMETFYSYTRRSVQLLPARGWSTKVHV